MVAEPISILARMLVQNALYSDAQAGKEMTVFTVTIVKDDGVGYVGDVYVVVPKAGYVCSVCDVDDNTPVMIENPLAGESSIDSE